MPTDQAFIDHVLDQVGLGARLTARRMFGEYGFHLDGTFVALACDNSLFIKPTGAIADSGLGLPERPPYPGARSYAVADGLLDDPQALTRLLLATAALLPKPKPKNETARRARKR